MAENDTDRNEPCDPFLYSLAILNIAELALSCNGGKDVDARQSSGVIASEDVLVGCPQMASCGNFGGDFGRVGLNARADARHKARS